MLFRSIVAGRTKTLRDAVAEAAEAIDKGRAAAVLEQSRLQSPAAA